MRYENGISHELDEKLEKRLGYISGYLRLFTPEGIGLILRGADTDQDRIISDDEWKKLEGLASLVHQLSRE